MESFKGKIYLLCAFTLAGTSVVAARLISGRLGTFTITAISLSFALMVLLPLCRRSLIQTVRTMRAAGWLITALQSLFGIFLFRMFLLQGLLRTSAGEAGILTGATPAFTAIAAYVVLKEQVSFKKLTGIGSTVCGILLIQGLLMSARAFTATHFWGNMLVLGAAASESTFNVISRIAVLKRGGDAPIRPIDQTTLVCAIALLLCLVPAAFEHPAAALASVDLAGWLSLAWYGLFVTALAFIFWYAGIKRCPAHTAAAFSGMMPFTSMLLSTAVLGESIHWQQWLGGGLVILGMVLIGIQKVSKTSNRIQT